MRQCETEVYFWHKKSGQDEKEIQKIARTPNLHLKKTTLVRKCIVYWSIEIAIVSTYISRTVMTAIKYYHSMQNSIIKKRKYEPNTIYI